MRLKNNQTNLIILDKDFYVNGKLVTVEDGKVPDVFGEYYEMLKHPIVIPARSYGFFQFRTW